MKNVGAAASNRMRFPNIGIAECCIVVFCVMSGLVPLQVWGSQPVCRVLDPELQGTYAGGCKDGLADGSGEARGMAEYKGQFRAGRKHGQGVKVWPATGDRYEGEFAEDRKHGRGTYSWGPKSPYAGERYSGDFVNDRREGLGSYEWPGGDRYSGPWKGDVITGPPTAAMLARARAEAENRAAVGRPGIQVCRTMTVGIGVPDIIKGTVDTLDGEWLQVRIEDAGQFQHVIAGVDVRKGAVVRDKPAAWTPCR